MEQIPSDSSITQIGDLIQLDGHRLICGDSTNPEIIKDLLRGEKPNLMVTEPPYEWNYPPSQKQEIDRSTFPDNPFLKRAWQQFQGNICYIWHSSLETAKIEKSLRDVGFELKSQIIWIKDAYEFTIGDYHWQHEPCLYAVRKNCIDSWKGSKTESTVWCIPGLPSGGSCKEDRISIHAAQKPLECMARPIRHNSKVGEAVYDPFCGSGSTILACEQLNRRCYAVEVVPHCCDSLVKRWILYRELSGGSPIVLRNGVSTEEYFESRFLKTVS